ncbi:CusA/CzcA family heavy metal efflux RND transporter [candidate division KSB1 bacterium]|nr:MAG: CusA/CzcA family heavy metal efflux RND transporter [candidate division KSB1 bacterium]
MIDYLITWAMKNRLLTIFITILIMVIGALIFRTLPVDVYPDLNAPLVNIITENYGMPPEDVEKLITRPLESIMNGAPHVTRVRSESSLGLSVVTVEFDWGTNIYLARQLVTSRLELVANQLPANTLKPVLGPVSSRMGEVFQFVVEGDNVDPMELRSTADWIIRYRLLGVPGISFVINLGGFIKQYQVLFDPTKLKNYNITISEVKRAIEESNYNPSGGLLIKGAQEYVVRGLGRIQSIEDIKNTVITERNNVPVYVKDVAEVKIGHQLRRGVAGRNGKNNEVVDVVIEKQYGGNTLTTISNLKKAIKEIEKALPFGIKITPYYDQSILIWKAIGHVEKAIIEGALLVILIIILFMGNIRSGLIASFTIPISVLFSFILMKIFHIGITVMSLGGLAIGIGKMANSSIIMVENIYRLLQKKKGTTFDLTLEASKEVGKHIFHASLIIILVFVPLFTLKGIEGRMFAPTAFAVAAALLGGLINSLTLKPVLCSLLLKKEKIKEKDNFAIEFFKKVYRKALDYCLRIKWEFLTVTVLIFLIILFFVFPRIGREFLPQMDEGSIILSTILMPGTSLKESDRIGRIIEKTMMKFPEVLSINRTTGHAEQSEHAHPVNHSHYIMEIKPKERRGKSMQQLFAEMRVELDKIPGIHYIFEQPIQNKLTEMLTGIEGQIAIKLFGPDFKVLDKKIEEIRDIISTVKGVADLRVEQTAGTPQIAVSFDRKKLARYGLNIGDVSDVIETALNGIAVTDVLEGHMRFPVFIRLQERFRGDLETIKKLLVDTPSGQRIPLETFANFKITKGPLTIMRENVTRRRVIICNVQGRDQGSWVEEAMRKVYKNVSLPAGYYIKFAGQFESQQRATKQLLILGSIVAVIVFFLLYLSFGSLKNVICIILNVPFAMMGGIIALWITGITFNVSSAVGFIALFGISIQNAIILVAFINDLRKEGHTLHDAIMEGSIIRLRPILMTELVIICGVLPLAVLTSSTGSELQQPMAVVYIGGELTAIFLTALQLPILYEIFEGGWKKKRTILKATKNNKV